MTFLAALLPNIPVPVPVPAIELSSVPAADATSASLPSLYLASTSKSPIAFVESSATAGETFATSTPESRTLDRAGGLWPGRVVVVVAGFEKVEVEVEAVMSEISVSVWETVRLRWRCSPPPARLIGAPRPVLRPGDPTSFGTVKPSCWRLAREALDPPAPPSASLLLRSSVSCPPLTLLPGPGRSTGEFGDRGMSPPWPAFEELLLPRKPAPAKSEGDWVDRRVRATLSTSDWGRILKKIVWGTTPRSCREELAEERRESVAGSDIRDGALRTKSATHQFAQSTNT